MRFSTLYKFTLHVFFYGMVIVTMVAMIIWGTSAGVSAQDSPTVTSTDTITSSPTHTQAGLQDPPTPVQISVNSTEPGQVTNAQANVLSVLGSNFTESTTVRLVGVGLLQTTFINANALTATIPAGITPGTYTIEVSDPVNGTATSPNLLNVSPPPPTPPTPFTPQPLPTFEVPTPFPTPLPPTPIPGQPSLIVRNFFADPATTEPGGTVTLGFEVVNVGNRAAEGVSVSLGSEGNFAPASGQASATIPNIAPGGIFEVSLTVIASAEATAGINNVPITMAYRDFSGETYTSSAVLSVNVVTIEQSSLVTIDSYTVSPNPVEPGQPMTLIVVVENSGNGAARRPLLRVAGEGGILLAGGQGDTFPLPDIPAGETLSIEIPMIVSTEADPGPQAQPITLSYEQGEERAEITSRVTIYVANPVTPLLLLESYDTGADVLQPGERFTFSLTIKNVGEAAAPGALITFGTVTGGGSSDPQATPGAGGGTGGDTVPSSVFAPIGSGSTILAGDIPADGTLIIEQDFIINGTVRTGIYTLPITVRYRKADGTYAQDNLQASIVIVAPPRLQMRLANPLPEMINAGEPFPIPLEIVNNGTAAVDLTRAVITTENAEIPEGTTFELERLRQDDDTLVEVSLIPQGEGDVRVTFTIYYRDELNTEQSLDVTFTTTAIPAPPLPEFTPPPEFTPDPGVPNEEPAEDDLLGRLLLGFLGLGG